MPTNTIILDEESLAHRVRYGSVDVFAVSIQNGQPAGPRSFLFTASAGQKLIGSPAVGPEGLRLIALTEAPGQLEALNAPEFNAAGWESECAAWCERLAAPLSLEFPLPGIPVHPENVRRYRIPEGSYFRTGSTATMWVRVDRGALQLFGVKGAEIGVQELLFDESFDDRPRLERSVWDMSVWDGGAGERSISEVSLGDYTFDGGEDSLDGDFDSMASVPIIPIPPNCWFKAASSARITILPVSALSLPLLRAATSRFQSLIGMCLISRQHQREAVEKARLELREVREQRVNLERARQLSEVVAPDSARRNGAAGGDILAALGSAIGVRFDAQAEGERTEIDADVLTRIIRRSRVRFRQVNLKENWWQRDHGPLLTFMKNEAGEGTHPVALIRDEANYLVVDPGFAKPRRLDSALHSRIVPEALTFFRPLPYRKIGLWDLATYSLRQYRRELTFSVCLGIVLTLLGMLLPITTRWVIDEAVPDAERNFLYQLFGVLVVTNLIQAAFLFSQSLITLRVQEGSTMGIQAAMMDRLLRLPTTFFREYTSGDVLNRVMMVTDISHKLGGSGLRTVLSSLLAFLNLGLLFFYSSLLASMALLLGGIAVGLTFFLSIAIRKSALEGEQLDGKLFGFVVQLVNGVAKLRIAGAGRRAFAAWLEPFTVRLQCLARAERLHDWNRLFNTALPTLASLSIYAAVAMILMKGPSSLSMGTFFAFQSAFTLFLGGLLGVSQMAVELSDSVAQFRLVKPLLQAVPEVDGTRADPGPLRGGIALRNICFRYAPEGRLILDNCTIEAAPGEFVALVGPSGSGKSTALRLILGFDRPESGTVFFDGMDLEGLDLTAVRQQLGVVLQNSKISAGSIFDNIAYGSTIRPAEALEAAQDAGLAEDLKAMPMGLHTVVSEGGTNLSGGQRQRLLIARALASNPRIIIFDEATSALDNLTQAIVTQSLNRRHVTRIVVAHRLSTIQTADRIYVLEAGRVVQAGNYSELAAVEGPFKRLVDRQTV